MGIIHLQIFQKKWPNNCQYIYHSNVWEKLIFYYFLTIITIILLLLFTIYNFFYLLSLF